jgi:hypothetical protein
VVLPARSPLPAGTLAPPAGPRGCVTTLTHPSGRCFDSSIRPVDGGDRKLGESDSAQNSHALGHLLFSHSFASGN